MIEVLGSPVGGENPPHDRRWRTDVAAAASNCEPAPAVALHFRLEPQRRVDLDNLARPALGGLRDAGVLARGFKGLDAIWTTKTVSDTPRLVIQVGQPDEIHRVPQPGAAITVAHTALPRDGSRDSKRNWHDCVRRTFDSTGIDGAVWLDIAVRSSLSLEGLLKPIIDGLEPLLGRDPSGRLEFTPNDHRVEWLRISRSSELPCPLVLSAGSREITTTPSPTSQYGPKVHRRRNTPA